MRFVGSLCTLEDLHAFIPREEHRVHRRATEHSTRVGDRVDRRLERRRAGGSGLVFKGLHDTADDARLAGGRLREHCVRAQRHEVVCKEACRPLPLLVDVLLECHGLDERAHVGRHGRVTVVPQLLQRLVPRVQPERVTHLRAPLRSVELDLEQSGGIERHSCAGRCILRAHVAAVAVGVRDQEVERVGTARHVEDYERLVRPAERCARDGRWNWRGSRRGVVGGGGGGA
mmetsp:Transcript_57819/g.151850  ORF Transcript_57819/g.151850 Transcript_57819/m.151850 type:complete len:230 (-) Transcript_57819:944-1633(-)